MKTWFPALLAVLILSGCATQPLDMSQGATNKVSVFSTQYEKKAPLLGRYIFLIQLLSVDGVQVKDVGMTSGPFYVKPGDHTLTVRIISHDNYYRVNPEPVEVRFTAKENTSYVIKLETTAGFLEKEHDKFVVVPFTGSETPIEKL